MNNRKVRVLIGGEPVMADLLEVRPRTVVVQLANGDVVKRKRARHVLDESLIISKEERHGSKAVHEVSK